MTINIDKKTSEDIRLLFAKKNWHVKDWGVIPGSKEISPTVAIVGKSTIWNSSIIEAYENKVKNPGIEAIEAKNLINYLQIFNKLGYLPTLGENYFGKSVASMSA